MKGPAKCPVTVFHVVDFVKKVGQRRWILEPGNSMDARQHGELSGGISVPQFF